MVDKSEQRKAFGTLLRRHRARLDATLKEVGEAVGVSEAHMSRLEHGNSGVSEDLVIKLAQLFGADPLEFLRVAGLMTDEPAARATSVLDAIMADNKLTKDQKRGLATIYLSMVPSIRPPFKPLSGEGSPRAASRRT